MACRGSIKQKHPWGRLGDTTEHQLSQTNGMSRFNQTETSFNKLRTYVNQIRTYVRIQFQEAYCTTRRRVICGGGGLGPEKKRITDRVLKNNRFSNCSGIQCKRAYSCNYFSISSSRSRNDKHTGLPFETWLCAAGHRRTAHMIQHNGCHTHPAIRYSTFA